MMPEALRANLSDAVSVKNKTDVVGASDWAGSGTSIGVGLRVSNKEVGVGSSVGTSVGKFVGVKDGAFPSVPGIPEPFRIVSSNLALGKARRGYDLINAALTTFFTAARPLSSNESSPERRPVIPCSWREKLTESFVW